MNSLRLIICSFLITIGNNCFASNEISAEIAKSLKHSMHEPNITSAVVSLLIVVCLIYITGIIYTKLSKLGLNTVKREFKNENDTNITILSTRQLGNNKTIHVIEIAGKRLLIGATQTSIQLLDVLSDKSDSRLKTFSVGKPQIKDTDEKEEIKNEEQKIDAEELGLYKKYLK